MILVDFSCRRCGVYERIVDAGTWTDKCPTCGRKTKRIFSVSRVYLGNQDGSYAAESAAALLDMDIARRSADPLERNLATNPNRENLQKYLKAKGLRHAENEKGAPPVYRRPPDPDLKSIADALMRRHQERKRIEI